MNFSEVMASIRYAFGSMFRFSGRDSRRLFWPWAIFVFLLMQAASLLMMVPAMFGAVTRAVLAAQKQDFAGETGPDPAVVGQVMGRMMADLGWLWIPTAVIDAITVALLAAAVTRRLHDRDKTALWGWLPLPFMAVGVAFMPESFAIAASPAAPSAAMRFLFMSAPLFWGALLWLCFLLAGEGTRGPNRFGEATRETP